MGDIASGNVSGFENYAYAALSGVVTGAIFSGVSGCSLFTKLGNMKSLLGKVGQSALLGGTGFGVGTLDSMGRQYVRSGTIDYQQALMDGALMGGVAGGGYLLSQFGPVNKLFGKLADTPFIQKLQQLDQKITQFFDGKRSAIFNLKNSFPNSDRQYQYRLREVDSNLDGNFLENAKSFQDKLPEWAKNRENFGYCEAYIDGLDNTRFFSHSAIQTELDSVKGTGISIKPETSPFKVQSVNKSGIIDGDGAWLRDVDTEYKILSDIQSKLGNNYSVSGKIKLYTELIPCPSCQSVISQFQKMYPNISIEVIYNIS